MRQIPSCPCFLELFGAQWNIVGHFAEAIQLFDQRGLDLFFTVRRPIKRKSVLPHVSVDIPVMHMTELVEVHQPRRISKKTRPISWKPRP